MMNIILYTMDFLQNVIKILSHISYGEQWQHICRLKLKLYKLNN